MTTEIDLPLECPRAYLAGERLESCVLTTVGDEIGRLTESLAALTTDERLLA